MRRVILLFAAFALVPFLGTAASGTNRIVTTAAEVRQTIPRRELSGTPFDLTVTVLYAHRHAYSAFVGRDGTGTATLWDCRPPKDRVPLREGDVIRIRGVISANENDPAVAGMFPSCESIEPVGQAPRPVFRPISASELRTLGDQDRCITLTGILRDAFRDEIDPNFIFTVLNCGGEEISAIFSSPEDPDLSVESLLGLRVTVSGWWDNTAPSYYTLNEGRSRQLSCHLCTHLADIRPTDNAPRSPFDVPEIPRLIDTSFQTISTLGRHKATGTVLAGWSGRNILLRTDDNRLVSANFTTCAAPTFGQRITVSGIPESDSYHIHLRNANWKAENDRRPVRPDETPVATTIRNLVSKSKDGRCHYAIALNGHAVALEGRYLRPMRDDSGFSQFNLEQNGDILTIDCSAASAALEGIPDGSEIGISGICVMQTRQGVFLPRIDGLLIALRSADDIRLLRRPPWWTFRKFVTLVSILLVLLVAVLVWTFTLKRLSERRGRALADEQVKRAVSDLKVYERTHLAVELHDSLSQTLSGVSMQIDAVERFADTDRERMRKHLGIAAKTLKSCRDELRNCLTDLRSNALEEQSMNEAIRQTLEPYSDDAEIAIRFFIPREILSDNTAHTILRIVRELVVNAIRHGHAGSVKIAGIVDGDLLRFSVTDDGCGFDVNAVPGLADGHFGLQGVRERVEGLDGEFTVDSTPGRGTKAVVSIRLPANVKKENVS